LTAVLVVCFAASGALAYTINDSSNDAIGHPTYESYGIDVLNFPGSSSSLIQFNFYTNFPQGGDSVISGPYTWNTSLTDLFFHASYSDGTSLDLAIPLVSHGSFNAGALYTVTSFLTSDNLDPSGNTGYFNYNHGIPVQIATGISYSGLSEQ
jgi:hypothetical protein